MVLCSGEKKRTTGGSRGREREKSNSNDCMKACLLNFGDHYYYVRIPLLAGEEWCHGVTDPHNVLLVHVVVVLIQALYNTRYIQGLSNTKKFLK